MNRFWLALLCVLALAAVPALADDGKFGGHVKYQYHPYRLPRR